MKFSIRNRMAFIFVVLAITPLMLVGLVLVWQYFRTQERQSLSLQSEVSRQVSGEVSAFFDSVESQLQIPAQMTQLISLNRESQQGILSEIMTYRDVFEELTLLNSVGFERAKAARLQVVEEKLSSRRLLDEFVVPSTTGEIYYGPVHYDERNGEPLITIAIPLQDLRTGNVSGVLVAETRIKRIWDLIAELNLSAGQSAYIVDAQNEVVAHKNPSVVLRGTNFTVPAENGVQPGLSGTSAAMAVNKIRRGGQEFNIVVEQEWAEALAPALSAMYVLGVIILGTLLVSIIIGVLSVRQIVRPIEALASTAGLITAGDLSQRAVVTNEDEIGTLAKTFNSMTDQLQKTLADLEQRVTERTKALTTSNEVSRRLSTILDEKQLVKAVVEQVQDAFDFYHVHIYLRDEASGDFIMAGGTGDAGAAMLARGHKILKGKGLVGRAAETNSPVLVQDTSQDPNWLPNPLLPETKSEVAVPISVGAEVLGVLDVQQNIVSGLNQEDVELLQSIANQVAIGVRNARSYEESRSQAELETLINTIGQKIQRSGTVEDVLQTAIREVGVALGATRVSASLQPSRANTESYDTGGGNGADPKR
jgi:putative methionine-R-sulfoxide reductase with GAF domain